MKHYIMRPDLYNYTVLAFFKGGENDEVADIVTKPLSGYKECIAVVTLKAKLLENKHVPNIISFHGKLLLDADALSILKPLLISQCQLIEAVTKHGKWHLLNPNEVVDCVDFTASDLELFHGRILEIRKLFLYKTIIEKMKIFSLEKKANTYIVDCSIKNAINESNLKGVVFDEVDYSI